ncbi:MAG: 2-hydroxyacyl-CoA dehydratase [Chloroflexi bacterium]|nr:2-hydroxyacyl-CoA dehydratase [Chloroflexota bacterium]
MDDWFHRIVGSRHEHAKNWKQRTGRKVVGYFCAYVPEELICATGALPVRVIGSLRPTELAEAHIPSMYCSFCRDVLAEGLSGAYDYLDGVVMAKSCIHLEHAFECWGLNIPAAFKYYLPMPWVLDSPEARKYYLAELGRFKEKLEDWSGKPITDDALGQSIGMYNRYRQSMHRLYDLRKTDLPLVSGAEVSEIVLASMLSDKEEFMPHLERAIQELPSSPNRPKAGARLMVAGGENYDLELFRVIESLGANVVIDELCMGSRYFWTTIPSPVKGEGKGEGAAQDRLEALADRYLCRPPCPAKATPSPRYEHLLGLVKDFKAQGVLLIQQKFCSPHALDIPDLMRFLKEHGVPSYTFEFDITLAKGQLRTRTEAFLEMLELEPV